MSGEFSSPNIDGGEVEKPERIDFSGLTFDELEEAFKEVSHLAKTTFREVENGFENPNGDFIGVRQRDGLYRVSNLSGSLEEIHRHLASDTGSILTRGTPDKEELMQAIKAMIATSEGRIIT